MIIQWLFKYHKSTSALYLCPNLMLPVNTDYDCMWLRVSIWSLWVLFKCYSDQNPTNPKWNCNTDYSKITKYTFYYLKTCHSLFKLLWFGSFIVTSAAQRQIRSIYLQTMHLTLQISPCFQHTGNDADQQWWENEMPCMTRINISATDNTCRVHNSNILTKHTVCIIYRYSLLQCVYLSSGGQQCKFN